MKKAGKAPRLDWLEALEERVGGAVERLAALAAENDRLAERIADLEAGGSEPETRPGVDAAWRREREEIRERVGKLTATLERLLPPEAAD